MIKKSLFRNLLLAGLLMSATGCASFQGGPFVDADEPHATLEAVINADVTSELFPGLIVKVDGQVIPEQNRRTYRLSPGQHTIGLEPDREAIQKYEDNYGRNYQLPRIFFEKRISIELQEGERYRFGVRIKDYNYADWQPVIEPVTD